MGVLRPEEGGFRWGGSCHQERGKTEGVPRPGGSPDGLGDLDFVQVKPLQGSKLKEDCALSPAFAGMFEPCYRAG